MLSRLIELCLRHRPIVVLSAILLVALGTLSFQRLPFDAFPDTTPVQVQINTSAPALAPAEVERQLTFPVEQAVSGLPGLTEVRSVSKFGLSQVVAVFDDDTDLYLARQVVSERLQGVELPAGVDRPALGPVSTGLGEIFQYLVHGEGMSAAELRTLHHWVIRPQLLQTPGVAEINTWGGREKQYHVIVDPERLLRYELTLEDVARAVRDANRNVGGGVLSVGGERQLIQGQGIIRDLGDLERVVVAQFEGKTVELGEVADLREDHEIPRGAVTADGEGEVVLGLGFMLMGENSLELARALGARLSEVRPSLPAQVRITPVYSRAELVEEVLATVRENLLVGALLVIAVCFISLGNLRAGLIVAAAIPLSLLFAFNAMLRFGIAGSLMSLGALDFGLVVDSSVIVVENAQRRLEDDEGRRSVLEVVRDAAVEVRRPTLFGELIIGIVYLPILTLEGVEGKLFQPMALTVLFALAGSMIASLTIMPVLASYMLERGPRRSRHRPVAAWVRARYRLALEKALARRPLVLTAATAAVLGSGLLATRLGGEFVPRLDEGAVAINTVRAAGVSLDESVRYGSEIERHLLAEFPAEIEHVWTRTGTAEVATDLMGVEVSDVFVTLTPRAGWERAATQDELVAAMAGELDGLPGMRSVFTQPIEMRVNEMLAGIRADVGIKVFGDDFEVLEERADAIRRVVEEIPGAADVSVEQLTGQPVLAVEVDREAAGRHGVSVHELLDIVEALGTRKVGEVLDGQRRFDLVLRLDDETRGSAERIGEMLVRTADGARIPLSRLARVEVREGPSTIRREWAQRRIVVQANVRGRDLGSFVADVRAALREVELPPGYYTRLGGRFEQLQRAQARLLVVVPISVLLVFALLYLTYGSALDALRVFTGVPFGAVGGILALWLRGMPFSVSAAVGFIALSGVSVLGDLVLVSRAKQLVVDGVPLRAAVLGAAETRLRPVLMTAMVAAIGFVPMAINTGVGAEVQRPIATVVIGGMLTSTLATLFVLPTLYVSLQRRRSGRRRAG